MVALDYAQSLLDIVANEFFIDRNAMGAVIAATQVSHGTGLILFVPLGDVLNR